MSLGAPQAQQRTGFGQIFLTQSASCRRAPDGCARDWAQWGRSRNALRKFDSGFGFMRGTRRWEQPSCCGLVVQSATAFTRQTDPDPRKRAAVPLKARHGCMRAHRWSVFLNAISHAELLVES